MTILSAKQLRRSFGNHEVLRGVDFSIDAGARVGFVGRNGSGKSTLAKILAGAESADSGEVVRRQGLTTAYLSQEPDFEATTPIEAVLAGLGPWQAAMQAHADASAQLEQLAPDADPSALLDQQANAAEQVEAHGGWDKRHEALAMLSHVGVTRPEGELSTMSGGERRRVALARVLVAEPELAILDEPTNHLDLDTVAWLEKWLVERFRGALILVTHDRYLLDRVVTRTVEMHEGEATAYEGGWGDYLEAKAVREAHEDRVESNRRNFLRTELEWLRRNPQARTTKQKARVKRAEAAIEQEGPARVDNASITMSGTRSGRTILEAENVNIEIEGRRLVDDLTLRLRAGERIGIVGPNGCGKTTLLRALTRGAVPAAGRITLGKNTVVAYLDQTRADLDDEDSIFDNVVGDGSEITVDGQVLTPGAYLERFLFRRAEQRKLVKSLSGGERARVALAKTLRSSANLVVLDEPTNDLDVDTLAALESALTSFSGCVLVVTHDRWFLDRVATSLLIFEGNKLRLEAGNYADWVARQRVNKAMAEASEDEPNTGKSKSKKARKGKGRSGLTHAERIELDGLLEKVDAAEAAVGEIEKELASEAFFGLDRAAQAERFAALEQARAHAESLTARWTELEEKAATD